MNSMNFGRNVCVVVILLVTVAALVRSAPSSAVNEAAWYPASPSPAPPTETSRQMLEPTERHVPRGSKMTRRMILPLLVGILLKVGSLLPVFLGKLTLMAIGSMVTSKLALIIAGILILHKFQSDHSFSSASNGHSMESEDSYTTYPYRRRG